MSEENKAVCANCGAELSEDVAFCSKCGTKVAAAVEEGGALAVAEETKLAEVEAPGPLQETPVVNVNPKVATPLKQKRAKIFLLGGIGLLIAIVVAVVLLVVFREIPVDALVVDQKKLELIEQESLVVSCTVYPTNATNKTVEWSSSDEQVATVNEAGLITAVAEGNCVVEVSSGEKTASVEITVKKDVPDFKEIFDEFCESRWAEVGSDGSYLQIDTNPYDWDEYWISDADAAIEKVNAALGLPDSLNSDIANTSWAIGKQSETFESLGIKVEWTYHPDKGCEIIYKLLNS